jgi:hypothetical protein
MKLHHTFILLLLMLLFSTRALSQQNVIFLLLPQTGASDEQLLYLSRGFYDIFLTDLVREMGKDFPCVGVTDPKTIMLCTQEIRLWATPAFGGQNIRPKIKKLSNSLLNPDYIVIVNNYVESEEMIRVEVKCVNAEGKLLADFAMPMEVNKLLSQDAFPPVKKLMEALKEYEICPYQGTIKVNVSSELNVDTKKEYPVYCQGMDRKYTMNFKDKKTADNHWTFEKETKVSAKGFLDFTISEVTELEIDNGCYKCPSGDMTKRYYRDKISKTGNIDGLSAESVLDGVPINDVRVEITFNDDDTYTMEVNAASKLGEISETIYRYAEGWCDAISEPEKTIKNKIDIGITYTFGPYKGTPKDKNLKEKPDPIVKIDPVSGEKKTIEVEFDLKRE